MTVFDQVRDVLYVTDIVEHALSERLLDVVPYSTHGLASCSYVFHPTEIAVVTELVQVIRLDVMALDSQFKPLMASRC